MSHVHASCHMSCSLSLTRTHMHLVQCNCLRHITIRKYSYTHSLYGVATISRLLNLYLSLVKEPYKRDDILQKRPVILSSLLIVATLTNRSHPIVICLSRLRRVTCPFLSHTHTHKCDYFNAIVLHIVICLSPSPTHTHILSPSASLSLSLSLSLSPSLSLYLSQAHAHASHLHLSSRGGGLGSRPIFKKFHETYAPS